MSAINISAQAYCKVILHAAKYPHNAVNGVLLAKKSSLKKDIEFVDAVPLFHVSINLSPMAEIALIQIDDIAAKEDLVIAGYYTAHENLKNNSVDKVSNRIVDAIARINGTAFIFVVNNSKLSVYLDNLALNVGQYTDGIVKHTDIQRVVLKPDTTLDTCSHLLEREDYSKLIDFDNHLDNIKLDWMNLTLNKEIEALL